MHCTEIVQCTLGHFAQIIHCTVAHLIMDNALHTLIHCTQLYVIHPDAKSSIADITIAMASNSFTSNFSTATQDLGWISPSDPAQARKPKLSTMQCNAMQCSEVKSSQADWDTVQVQTECNNWLQWIEQKGSALLAAASQTGSHCARPPHFCNSPASRQATQTQTLCKEDAN